MQNPGDGEVFGRIAVIRDGEVLLSELPSFPKEFGWGAGVKVSGMGHLLLST